MSNFKVGDKVRFVGTEGDWHKGLIHGEVYEFDGYALPTDKPWIWLKSHKNSNNDGSYSEGVFELANVAEPKSPIQEEVVKKRKLVPGEYGNLSIYESQGDLRIEFNKSKHTAEELEEASHILAQLAEFLREEGK